MLLPFALLATGVLDFLRLVDRPTPVGGSTFLLQPKGTSLRHRLDTDDELFLSFVGSLLCLNPDDRPTAEQALQHPWIATDPYGPGAVSDSLAT